ncbi:MAG TPA: hypothetical protein VKB58_06995 [Terriglobales bacterium]|nr:hypothetical protein [Terriglobales bacterium]
MAPAYNSLLTMTADQYLHTILLREAVDAGPNSPLLTLQATLMPILRQWAGDNLLGVHPSGSFMKGTAVRSGTDIDLFLSLSEHTSGTLKELYNKLFDCLTSAGYSPRRQNVSLNISVPEKQIPRRAEALLGMTTLGTHHGTAESRALSKSNYSVDLVPGKRQNALSSDHSLYRRKADTWTKTNVLTHAQTVIGSGRADEIRVLKLWRNQKGLDFPSFYLELSVIRALAAKPLPGLVSYNPQPTLSQRVIGVFDYLRDSLPTARIADPANSNNIISDDLTAQEKARVSAAAKAAREAAASSWEDIVR